MLGYILSSTVTKFRVRLHCIHNHHQTQINEEIPNGYLLIYFALRAGLEEGGPAEGCEIRTIRYMQSDNANESLSAYAAHRAA